MYVNTLDPTLFQLGFLQIRWYGLVYVLGFGLVYWLLRRSKSKLNLSLEQIDNLILSLFVGLLVGARIFHFIFNQPSVFINDPLELLKIWHGGMSFFGALVGCLSAAVWYLKKISVEWKPVADVIVIGATVAIIFGRIANFINGELVGTVSAMPWCVVFPTVDSFCRHPYQLYASLSHIVLLGALLALTKIKEKRPLPQGIVFLCFVAGYSLLRFITDFFRDDPRMWGLTSWQYVAVIVFSGGMYVIARALRKSDG